MMMIELERVRERLNKNGKYISLILNGVGILNCDV